MDETELTAALRRATDDVRVPRDLVRHAERLGRERRARRRSGAAALAVSVVVLAGGALVVTQRGSGGESSATPGAGSASSRAAAPAPPAGPAPASAQDAGPGAGAGSSSAQSAPGVDQEGALQDAACGPALVVDGVPARPGYATSVPAGGSVEITGAPLPCARVPRGARYALVLAPAGSTGPTVLAEAAPAEDGSFSARVTLPDSTPPGRVRLSVEGSTWEQQPCPDSADCLQLDYGADLDVLVPEPAP